MLKKTALLLLIFLPLNRVFAQESADAFHRGIEAYQAKDYAKAKDLFLESLTANPESIAINTNLGMTFFNLGDRPRALAHLRRARALDPSASTPREALQFLRTQGVATDMESADGVKAFYQGMLRFAARVPSAVLFVLAPLALLWFGWTLIQYLVRRRDAEEGAPFPKTTVFAGALWVLFLGLQILQALHDQAIQATVVTEKTAILSAPSETAPSLFEAVGGEELEVFAVNGAWSQVANLRGEFGWAKSADLFVTSRRQTP